MSSNKENPEKSTTGKGDSKDSIPVQVPGATVPETDLVSIDTGSVVPDVKSNQADESLRAVPTQGEAEQEGDDESEDDDDGATGTDDSKPDPDAAYENELPVLKPTEKLRIASWNCGGGLSNFVNAVFIILMNIFKMDIIFVQELKSLKFTNLLGYENYRLIKLPPLKNGHPKRGLFLMYRKEIEHSMYNTRKERTGNCSHTNNKVTRPKENIEFCSIDVLMEDGLTRRLINLYHAPAVQDDCASELDTVLGPLARNIETVLMGDANLKSGDEKLQENEFAENLKKYAMFSRLPEGFKTHFLVPDSWTQPDILYSSVKNKKNLLIHKPLDPHELILNIMKVFDTNFLKDPPNKETIQAFRQLCEQVSKPSQSKRPGTDMLTDLTNILDVISLEDLRRNEAVKKIRALCRAAKKPANIKSRKYHCILIVELGKEVNASEYYQCSTSANLHCSGDCSFFRQSVKRFLNSELNPT